LIAACREFLDLIEDIKGMFGNKFVWSSVRYYYAVFIRSTPPRGLHEPCNDIELGESTTAIAVRHEPRRGRSERKLPQW